MEANTLPGGMLPGLGPGMLGLEMPLHNPHHQQHPPPQASHPHHQQQSYPHHQNHPHLSMVNFNTHESDPHAQAQQPVKQNNNYPFANKPKQQPQQQQLALTPLSDEEEHGFNGEDGGDGRKRVSPWQRVKWTDNMVKLLIMVVFCVGDDTSPEGGNTDASKKKGGLLQKKGKWKSVSRAMMEKGFYVSPQQCEDKFNDLNKRYKRVNDILGRGTACKVVENQALLESMDQLSPKMKDEARKLLNSKHLFFREMCAYHTNGGGGGERVAHQALDVAAEPSTQYQQQQQQQQQPRCFHSSQNNVGNVNLRNRMDTDELKMSKGGGGGGGGGVREHEDDADGEEDDNDEEEDEEDEDENEEEEHENGGRDCGKGFKLYGGGHEEEDDEYKSPRKKRQRRGGGMFSSSSMVQQLNSELMNVIQDGSKSPWEQRQWMRNRSLQLEEQRVGYQCQAFELEKQRLKWIKFSMEKERDLERMKLNNERMRLENERMVLLLRQKELELFDHHQQQHSSSKRPEPSSMTG